MLVVGALALAYAFCYASGGLSELGYLLNTKGESKFFADEGKNDATLYSDIQGFNDILMYFGIVMILLAVLLYIASCNRRRNYYITNYVATGVCAGGNIVLSIVAIALNSVWLGKFKNVDFASWLQYNADGAAEDVAAGLGVPEGYSHFSDSTLWFALGYVVYAIVIIASVLLILNLVWKIKLMQGEKKLLNGAATVKDEAVVEAEGGAEV